jgi:hypothetical protein
MTSILSYTLTRFIDIVLLISIIYVIQKNIGSGMTMNITDQGNLTFALTLSIMSYIAGVSQTKMELSTN